MTTDWVLELAENANTYVPLPAGDERSGELPDVVAALTGDTDAWLPH